MLNMNNLNFNLNFQIKKKLLKLFTITKFLLKLLNFIT